MSIQRIGRDGLNPLVLMNLTRAEREALAQVLTFAEHYLDTIPNPEHLSDIETMIFSLRGAAEGDGRAS